MSIDISEENFNETLNKAYEEKVPNFSAHVNIALVGKVSSGKSSLLNAILGCTRENIVAPVGATSGVTTEVKHHKFDENVLIIDCPGLDDVKKENSKETKDFLATIDLGIFVVTGSADASQKENFDELKKSSGKTIVVLNKIDEWDDLEVSAYEAVVDQWKGALGVDKVFGVNAKGYDPMMRKDAPMDIRGVDDVRNEIFDYLKTQKKDVLLAKHLKSKEQYALGIIGAAIVAVSAEAFIPGSAAYITATQVVAISSLTYLYTGKVLSKSSALAMLPRFAAKSAGTTAFLWAKSFLPPTGVVDAVAAVIAATITFAMLAAVKWMHENGHSLEENGLLAEAFSKYRKVGDELKEISLDDLKSKGRVVAMLGRILSKSI